MKLECLINKIKPIISASEKVTAKNHSLPILGLIILEAKNNILTIKSTNLEVGLEAQLAVKVFTPGQIAVNAQIFNQFLNLTTKDDDHLEIELINNNLSLKTNKSTSTLKTYSTDDFPFIPKINNKEEIIIPLPNFITGLKSVIYASATSDIKPEIASVYIYQHQDNLIFVSTDSFRLAEKSIKYNTKLNLPSLIVPIKNIVEVLKVIEEESGEIKIKTSENQISFLTDNFYLTSRVINSTFPDYRQIIPQEFKTKIEVDRDDLINTLKLANIFSDKFNQITIKTIDSKDGFEIYAHNQEVGDNKTKIKAVITGEEIEVNFNARYIIDSLSYFTNTKINLCFNEKNKPLLILGSDDKSFKYLVMPVNR
ncbi:MAG: DNA polymerase III subunit beta [bacterium]|nr:DNA polymerase III subunit beta [bacterium]